MDKNLQEENRRLRLIVLALALSWLIIAGMEVIEFIFGILAL